MAIATTKVKRATVGSLGASFGPDRDKRVIVVFVPGDGRDVPDVLELRPYKTRRIERIAVLDVYRYALRCRVNLALLDRARKAKERKAERLAAARRQRAEKRMTQPL
jgi:hypothetical protein